MPKRPRTSESSDFVSGSNSRWSLGRLTRLPSLSSSRSSPASPPHLRHKYSKSLHDAELTSDVAVSTADNRSSPVQHPSKTSWQGSTNSPQSHATTSSPHNHRSPGTVARELVSGFQSFVTNRLQRTKTDPKAAGQSIDELAYSHPDALAIGVWTPEEAYTNTLRIRDEYSRLVTVNEMQGVQTADRFSIDGSEDSCESIISLRLAPPCNAGSETEEIALSNEETNSSSIPLPQKKMTLEDLEVLDTLGTGTFGRVLLARLKQEDPDNQNNYFALKVLNKSQIVRLKQIEHINSECAVLSKVDHPFVVKLHGTFQDSLNCYMLMEFVVGGEIFTHLRRAKTFSGDVTRFYIASLVLAIAQLHSKRIIYRDLKPENLLIDSQGYIKMTDFGFAKELLQSDRTWTLCGTPEYLSPEVILSRSQSLASDYWCLGILMYEMLCGHPPFYDSTPFGTYEKILAANVHFPKNVDPLARDLIKCLLTVDVSKRLGNLRGGAQDVMNHPWFNGVDWTALAEKRLQAPFIPHQSHPSDSSNFEKYSHFDISNMPGMNIGMQADRSDQESDPWKHHFTAF